MALLIKNGEIVTSVGRQLADIYCEDEQITKIAKRLDAPLGTQTIDASGKYIFPGFVDPHVHAYLPFMGTSTSDDYASVSRAALRGGTTCFIDFVNPNRDENPLDAIERWNSQSVGCSACDFSYHIAISRWDNVVEQQLREIVSGGITSFKIYLAYKETFNIDYQRRWFYCSRNNGIG